MGKREREKNEGRGKKKMIDGQDGRRGESVRCPCSQTERGRPSVWLDLDRRGSETGKEKKKRKPGPCW